MHHPLGSEPPGALLVLRSSGSSSVVVVVGVGLGEDVVEVEVLVVVVEVDVVWVDEVVVEQGAAEEDELLVVSP